MNSEMLILGLKTYEALTLLAIVLGPVIAVSITLFFEKRRKLREQRVQTVRMLVSTRHLPSDPAYTTAINMIPIDFNSNRRVMAAWHAYIDIIRYPAPAGSEEQKLKDMLSKQTKLIFEALKCLDYELSETDIQATPYAADGFIRRDMIMIEGWQAWPRIAAALERQNSSLLGDENVGTPSDA